MSQPFSACPPAIRALHNAGILRDIDTQLAEAMVRTHRVPADADPAGWLALTLASRAVGDGHVCLDLDALSFAWVAAIRAECEPGAERGALPDEIRAWCLRIADPRQWAAVLAGWAPVVGSPDDAAVRPFVLDGRRLYLRRMYDYERQAAAKLREMAGGKTGGLPAGIAELIDRLLDDHDQRQAARMALTRRLTIITGGPGTGKTYVVARILALLSHLPKPADGVLRVRLAAPTGKAAARMGESIREARAKAGDDFGPGVEIAPACTLERLLGFRQDSPYFRHDAAHPLDADVVIVDEASMVDLAKMAKLLDALGEGTRLVLLGDMHQLASVQPGSVLAEICEARGLAGCVAKLTTSRRFPAGSAVDRLSRAVNAVGSEPDALAAWAGIEQPADRTLGRVQTAGVPGQLAESREFACRVLAGYREFLAAETPADAFKALAGFRILCALRHGPWGSLRVNALVEEALALRGVAAAAPRELRPARPLRPTGDFYSHRVVMVTRNDYATGLFNGDVGVVLPDRDSARGDLVVYFPRESERAGGAQPAFRKVPCRLLPERETAFAMTIHKSQGSEFGRVLVLVPERDTPILTRELLYTAITRCVVVVELWCSREVFVRAACRRVQRFTGGLGSPG